MKKCNSRGELCSPASLKGMEKQLGAVGMSCLCKWQANAVRPSGAVEQTGDVETQESYEIAYPK